MKPIFKKLLMKPETEGLPATVFAPFTAFPNVLIDTLMPTLKDTEWRLLCVIVRQTIGWSEPGGKRKQRDWLTQRQLMQRTGRNSAALSAAMDVLVSRRLVNAWDEAGEMLMTPAKRRRHQGRVYYGLCPETLQVLIQESSKTPLRKANTTKENKDKRKLNKGRLRRSERQSLRSPLTALSIYTGWTRVDQVIAARSSNTPDS